MGNKNDNELIERQQGGTTMKWYEKQKKMFEDKLNKADVTTEADAKLDEITTSIFDGNESNVDLSELKMAKPFEEPAELDENTMEDAINDAAFEEVKQERVILQTLINKGTKFNGNIETEGDLILSGDVVGNVNCFEKLVVSGTVQGDVVCGSGDFVDTDVVGNIICKESMSIQGDTQINGNISAASLTISGTVIGDVCVNGVLKLLNNAYIEGKIEAQYMESERGAVIKGSCTIAPVRN